ncbi:DNA repair protein RecN [Aliikangiella sp. IMCC44653]
MLTRIEIRNFAIIQSLDLDWSKGMTVITGETGAGKSIVIDALGMTLGERVEQHVVYPNAQQAEVTAVFELPANSAAQQWLIEQQLTEEGECIIRRVVVREGRSKCFINGRSVPLSQLRALAEFLVDIHGQHAHQTLLRSKEQLNLVDRYANHPELLAAVRDASLKIKKLEQRKAALSQEKQARDAKRDLLIYQVDELADANPEQSQLEQLEQQHKEAATCNDRLEIADYSLLLLDDDEASSVLGGLAKVVEQIEKLHSMDNSISNLQETLIQAENLLQEAKHDLSHYRDRLEVDPQVLAELDQQLAQFHDLARKHQVKLGDLPTKYLQLQQELEQLNADESELEAIEQAYQQALKDYQKHATKLSKSRADTAKRLQKLVTEQIQLLAMDGGKLEIQLKPIEHQHSSKGQESAEFMVSANPGQPLQPLNKVASGGELSRISLAIAVITAQQQLVPSLIFDEVDVGIGGGTAEVVGRLLKQLGENRQVICVTHQPQVASCGHQHLIASKTKLANATVTQMTLLNQAQRVQEIGRMLGGLVISDKTLSHAKEMLGV